MELELIPGPPHSSITVITGPPPFSLRAIPPAVSLSSHLCRHISLRTFPETTGTMAYSLACPHQQSRGHSNTLKKVGKMFWQGLTKFHGFDHSLQGKSN